MSADVYPVPTDLPPGSQAFARETIRRVEELQRAVSSADTNQGATNQGLGSSIQVLSQQFRDLVGRVSYQIGGTDTLSWTSSATGPIPFGPVLTFTLTERRVVSVTFNARMSATAQMSSPGTATSSMSMSILLDGQSLLNSTSGTAGYIVAQAVNAGSNAYNNVTQSSRYLVTLDAGVHTVQGVVPGVSRINGIGSLDISNPSVFVDVYQTA